jgi:hypothetical protein
MRASRIGLLVVALAGCSKCDDKGAAAAAPDAASAPVVSASASARKHKREDRHDQAEVPASLTLDVTIGGATKTWKKDSFEKVARFAAGSVGNDGEDRDTWSLRELAHTLVGPNARVVAVIGDETSKIDRAAWDDASKTPIIHTTRRGTFKFRWADKAGKWGDADVRDVTRIEIEP